jgi:phosphate transport system permease protein
MSAVASKRSQDLRALIRAAKRWDKVFTVIGILALMVGILTLAALFVGMVIDGVPRLTGDFFTNFPSRRASQAGILSAWVGSMLVMIVTGAFAVPVGIASAIYLEEYAKKNWVTDVIEINISNLAGVPSIVYGLLALGLFVYTFGFGQSILSAGLTLALLILPIVIVATREALRAIPQHIREGAYACGASQWQVVSHHLVPYGLPGILTGVIIGMARAIGETAPIITIGALTFIAFLPPVPFSGEPPAGLFDWLFSPFTVMPIQIFNWTSRPDPAFHQNAAAASFVLVFMTLGMNALAIWLRYKLRKNIKW